VLAEAQYLAPLIRPPRGCRSRPSSCVVTTTVELCARPCSCPTAPLAWSTAGSVTYGSAGTRQRRSWWTWTLSSSWQGEPHGEGGVAAQGRQGQFTSDTGLVACGCQETW
jgi:hypothetical protein